MLWRQMIIAIALCGPAFATSPWDVKQREGEAIILFDDVGSEPFSPDLKGLEKLLAAQKDDVTYRHLCFWNYLEADAVIQEELMESFKETYPSELDAALRSLGNMHNPKVRPLSSHFSECLLRTPSVQKINALFHEHGYEISSTVHEKFRIEKDADKVRFKAIVWLKVTRKAEQADSVYP